MVGWDDILYMYVPPEIEVYAKDYVYLIWLYVCTAFITCYVLLFQNTENRMFWGNLPRCFCMTIHFCQKSVL